MPLWQWAQVQEVLFKLDDGGRVSRRVVCLVTLCIWRCQTTSGTCSSLDAGPEQSEGHSLESLARGKTCSPECTWAST